MRKKILIFILCFSLIFTTSIYHDNDIKVVKGSTAVALSLITLALTSIGFTYYSVNNKTNLANDIEVYCRDTNQDYSTFLNGFQTAVIDVGRDIVKFTAAQVYALKQFCSYLLNNNKVSEVPLNSNSFSSVPLFGYSSLLLVKSGDIFRVSGSGGSAYIDCEILNTGLYNEGAYVCFYGTYDFKNKTYATQGFRVAPTNLGNSVTYKLYYSDGSIGGPYGISLNSDNVGPFSSIFCNRLGSSPFFYCLVNGSMLCNAYYNYNNVSYAPENTVFYTYNKYLEACKLRFGYSSITNSYTGVVLPSYSVNQSVFNTADDTKPLVVTVPDVMDKAIDVAIRRDPNATAITVDDLAIAIDDTAIGSIDSAEEEEEDKVIAPTIDLPVDISQDLDLSDSIVEDLVISDPLPPPEPPEPPDVPIVNTDIGSKFPFSIFFDFVVLMELFDREPEAPSFNLGFELFNDNYEFTIDLSDFDSVARVLRLMELIAFISGLIFLTIKYIRGKD